MKTHRFRTSIHHPQSAEAGLSLIELMVAMTLGIVVISGIAAAFLGSKQSYRVNENLARMQESARFAFDILTKEVRMAGYFGCAGNNGTTVNTLNNATNYAWALGRGIYGFESTGASTWSPAVPASGSPQFGPPSPKGGNDILTVRGIMGGGVRVLEQPGNTSADLKVTANSGLAIGDIVMVTDCVANAILQITNKNVTADFDNVVHNTGSGDIPGNATKDMGRKFEGAEIVKLSTRTYYIRDNASGVPALYRLIANGDAEEMVDDVEAMQIRFGVDTTGDFAVDSYRTADWVEANAQWDNVITAQISLLVRSPEDRVAATPQTYSFNGATITATDRRLRQTFTSTVTLRNRTF